MKIFTISYSCPIELKTFFYAAMTCLRFFNSDFLHPIFKILAPFFPWKNVFTPTIEASFKMCKRHCQVEVTRKTKPRKCLSSKMG